MPAMRRLALIFLCCCLAAAGAGEAASMKRMPMESTDPAMAMDADCPAMAGVEAAPSDHVGVLPLDRTKPDCCKDGACACAGAHVAFAMAPPAVPLRHAALSASVAASGGSVYASPALARLVRPPIS